jgi:hypothetical protein
METPEQTNRRTSQDGVGGARANARVVSAARR